MNRWLIVLVTRQIPEIQSAIRVHGAYVVRTESCRMIPATQSDVSLMKAIKDQMPWMTTTVPS